MNELKNCVALITRPIQQAQKLREKIEAFGGKAILFPTVEIISYRDSEALKNAVENIRDYSIAIFSSANAVEAVDNAFSNIIVIAIGPGTAAALKQRGISVAHIPEEFSSAGLLRLPILNEVAAKKIAIFCGENPKPELKETLIQRGALVSEIFCYRRERPMPQILSEDARKSINVIISLSRESVQNLFAMFEPNDVNWLLDKTLLVATSEMMQCARDHGWKGEIIIAKNPSDEAVVESLLDVEYKILNTLHKDMNMDANQNSKENPATNWPLLFLTLIVGVLVAGVAYLVWQQSAFPNRPMASPAIALMQKQIADQQNAIERLEKKSQPDLSEVYYLVNLAHLNLTVGRDLESAQNLLKLALQKISLQNNSALLPLRQSLESDLGRLSTLTSFNIESVILELDNINQRIQATSIMPNLAFKPAVSKPAAPKLDEKWYQRVLNSLSGLKDLFIIRHINQNMTPLIAPQDERYLKENIQAKLLQAEWAVINQKPLLYERSLKDISAWLIQYFHDPKTIQPILDSLAKLQSLNVKPNYSGLENSLRLLMVLDQNSSAAPTGLEKKTLIMPLQDSKTPAKIPAPAPAPAPAPVPEKAPGTSGVAI